MFAVEHYYQARSVNEACQLLQVDPDARLIAGGTDVLIRLREGKPGFSRLVDIHDLKELQQIELQDDGTLVIGSGVNFTQLIEHPQVLELIPVLAAGGGSLGGPQVRNMATLGGNVCNGAPSGDSAAPLLVLDTTVHIQGVDGERQLPVEDFYQGPGRVQLERGELVTHFSIAPQNYRNSGADFFKYAMRDAMDIATIGCAALCQLEENRIKALKLAYTVAAPTPKRCRDLEQAVVGAPVSQALIRDIAGMAATELNPRDSWRASKAFRLHVIQTLAQQVVSAAIKRAGGQL